MAQSRMPGKGIAALVLCLIPTMAQAQRYPDPMPVQRMRQPMATQPTWPGYGPGPQMPDPNLQQTAGKVGDFPDADQVVTNQTKPFQEIPPVFPNCAPHNFTSSQPQEGPDFAFVEGGVWVSAEYLFWQTKNAHLEFPIVTTSRAPDAVTDFGAVGQPNTLILLGNEDLDYGDFPGYRIGLGIQGIELGFVYLEPQSVSFNFLSDATGNPVLARPLFAIQLGEEVVFLGSFPGLAAGGITLDSTSALWGFDINLVLDYESSRFEGQMLFGFKYLQLTEDLDIANNQTSINPAIGVNFVGSAFGPGFTTVSSDEFETRNRFRGASVGRRTELCWGPLFATFDAKLGIGFTDQEVEVGGVTTLYAPGGQLAAFAQGGILAVPSNSGRQSHEQFSVVPELTLNVGIEMFDCIRAFVGYDFLYWSSVVRPADQLNRVIDTRQIPTDTDFGLAGTTLVPSPPFVRTDYWAHGFHVGLAIHF